MLNHPALASARSFLFVPGNRPERFEKAMLSGADAVIFDLEDSVPAAAKSDARQALANYWLLTRATGIPRVVRINAADGGERAHDLAAISALQGLSGLMVPKAESPEDLAMLHQLAEGVALLPLIETEAGLHAVRALATAPGVLRLAVGNIDFMADTGLACGEQEDELIPLRFGVAMATRAARLASAIDGVTVETGDERKLQSDVARALRFGFGAKLCIHPRQVAGVHRALAPTEAELDWARRVIAADEAAGGAAVQLDGRMVDLPVVLRARRTLSLSFAGSPPTA